MDHLCPGNLFPVVQRQISVDIMETQYDVQLADFTEANNNRPTIINDETWKSCISSSTPANHCIQKKTAPTNGRPEVAMEVFVPWPQEDVSKQLKMIKMMVSGFCKGLEQAMDTYSTKLLEAWDQHEIPRRISLPITATTTCADAPDFKATLWIEFTAVTEEVLELLCSPSRFPAHLGKINGNLFALDGVLYKPTFRIGRAELKGQYKCGQKQEEDHTYNFRDDKAKLRFKFVPVFDQRQGNRKPDIDAGLMDKAKPTLVSICKWSLFLWRMVPGNQRMTSHDLSFAVQVENEGGEQDQSLLFCASVEASFTSKKGWQPNVKDVRSVLDQRFPVQLQVSPWDLEAWMHAQGLGNQVQEEPIQTMLEKALPPGIVHQLLQEDSCRCERSGTFECTLPRSTRPNAGQVKLKLTIQKVSDASLQQDSTSPDNNSATGENNSVSSVSSEFLPWTTMKRAQTLRWLLDGEKHDQVGSQLEGDAFLTTTQGILKQFNRFLGACLPPNGKTIPGDCPFFGDFSFGDGIVVTAALEGSSTEDDGPISPIDNTGGQNCTERAGPAPGETTPSPTKNPWTAKTKVLRSDSRKHHWHKLNDIGFKDDLDPAIAAIADTEKKENIKELVEHLSERPAILVAKEKKGTKKTKAKQGKPEDPKSTLKAVAKEVVVHLLKNGKTRPTRFVFSDNKVESVPVTAQSNKNKITIQMSPTRSWKHKNAKKARDRFVDITNLLHENQFAAKIRLARDEPTKILQTAMETLLEDGLLTNEPGALFCFSLINQFISTSDCDATFPEEDVTRDWFVGSTKKRLCNYTDTFVALMKMYAGLPITGGNWPVLLSVLGEANKESDIDDSIVLLFEIMAVMLPIMEGFLAIDDRGEEDSKGFEPTEVICRMLWKNGQEGTKSVVEKIGKYGAIDYESFLNKICCAGEEESTGSDKTVSTRGDSSVSVHIFLLLQMMGVLYYKEGGGEGTRPRNLEVHEEHQRSILIQPHYTWRASSNQSNWLGVLKLKHQMVPLPPAVTYRTTQLDDDGQPLLCDGDTGKPDFKTKTTNFNMWRGPFESKAILQPAYNEEQKGTQAEIRERGYEPQCYKLPEGGVPWTARPTAVKVADQQDVELEVSKKRYSFWEFPNRHVKRTKITFDQYHKVTPPDKPFPPGDL